MELNLSRLRRWLFALCQARSGQCLKPKEHHQPL
ncbi:hypothetical protein ACVWYU_003482 [Pseudomonas sp. TE12234]|jgi:hypothetical protein|uniref:Uncharacterized protein n=1 Tax=Pseudomonas moorei TaxID=395599 RepID=A0A1H0YNX2_9PSED|nr:hypothetical protein SAMN04490195_0757 [Pseudomonas moorei]